MQNNKTLFVLSLFLLISFLFCTETAREYVPVKKFDPARDPNKDLAAAVEEATESGRRIVDWIKVHTPIFGTMINDAIMTRSMRILSTMVNTGVPLLDALASPIMT